MNQIYLDSPPWLTRIAPPVLGEHTEEVLSGLLGMTAGEIAALRAKAIL